MKKRLLAILYVTTMILFISASFSACGTDSNLVEEIQEVTPTDMPSKNIKAAVKEKVTNVYENDKFAYPGTISHFSDIKSLEYYNGKAYILSQSVGNSGCEKQFLSIYDISLRSYIESDIKSNENEHNYVTCIDLTSNGNLCALFWTNYYDSNGIIIRNERKIGNLDEKGQLINAIKLPSYYYSGKLAYKRENDYQEFIRFSQFFIDSEGNYVVADESYGVIAKFDKDFQMLNVIALNEKENLEKVIGKGINQIFPLIDGTILVELGEYNNRQFVKVNLDTEEVSLCATFDTLAEANKQEIFAGNDKYDFFFDTPEAIYGYKFETGISTEIVNCINSNMTSSQCDKIIPTDEGFLCCVHEYNMYSDYFVLLKKSQKEEQERYTIRLGGVLIDSNALTDAVLSYNQNSKEYRIQVEDYYYKTIGGEDEAFSKLQKDIIEGKGPDIICTDSLWKSDFSIPELAAKGYLADIYPYLSDRKDINDETYFMNVLEAFLTGDKLYSLVSSYGIAAFAGKEKVLAEVESGWTIEEFIGFNDSLEEKKELFFKTDKDEILDFFISAAYDTYIDEATQTCHFDTEEFKRLLALIKDKGDIWSKSETTYSGKHQMYANEEILLEPALIYDIYDYVSYCYMYADYPKFVGAPGSIKTGGAIIPGSHTISLLADSPYVDAAWEFAVSLLEDDFQKAVYYDDKFCVKKDIWEDLCSECTFDTEKKEQDAEDRISLITEREEYFYGRSPETLSAMYNLTMQSRCRYAHYEVLLSIIREEVNPYFNDKKTVDEVIKAIQDRVQKYLDDNWKETAQDYS